MVTGMSLQYIVQIGSLQRRPAKAQIICFRWTRQLEVSGNWRGQQTTLMTTIRCNTIQTGKVGQTVKQMRELEMDHLVGHINCSLYGGSENGAWGIGIGSLSCAVQRKQCTIVTKPVVVVVDGPNIRLETLFFASMLSYGRPWIFLCNP